MQDHEAESPQETEISESETDDTLSVDGGDVSRSSIHRRRNIQQISISSRYSPNHDAFGCGHAFENDLPGRDDAVRRFFQPATIEAMIAERQMVNKKLNIYS